jgi:DNA-binding response OmpR family regulator
VKKVLIPNNKLLGERKLFLMSTEKIILIEDDEILSKVLFTELSDAGFKVLQAFDGETGLELIKSSQPDLVLLDLVLPKKLGLEVLEELKDSTDTENIPVIILTLLGEDEDIKKGLALGAEGYLVKSTYTAVDVVGKLKNFFAGKSHPQGDQIA